MRTRDHCTATVATLLPHSPAIGPWQGEGGAGGSAAFAGLVALPWKHAPNED